MNIAAPLRRLFFERSRISPPLRLSSSMCGVLAALSCLCAFSDFDSARGEETEALPVVKPSSTVKLMHIGDAAQGALLNMRVGRVMAFPLPDGATYSLLGDSELVEATSQNGSLVVKALNIGQVVLSIDLPVKDGEAASPQKYSLRIVGDAGSADVETSENPLQVAISTAQAPAAEPAGAESGIITAGAGAMAAPPRPAAYTTASSGVESAVASTQLQATALREVLAALRVTVPQIEARSNAPSAAPTAVKVVEKPAKIDKPPMLATSPVTKARQAGKTTTATTNLSSVISNSSTASPARLARADKGQTQIIARAQLTPAQVAPDLPELEPITASKVAGSAQDLQALSTPFVDPPGVAAMRTASMSGLTPAPEAPAESEDVVVSPPMRPLANVPAVGAGYAMHSTLPPDLDATAKRPLYRVTQGMARILAFKSNILSVFFSDDNVMDARAINARTIGVTGKGPGKSTLAVFLSRYPNDVVGRAVIYNIEVYPAVARAVPVGFTDPAEAETAIRTALNDPRVRVSVYQRPDGSLVAQLAGGLRNSAEVEAAAATASLFVPNVISSLYADPQAPTLEAALQGPSLTADQALQETLRGLFANETIELVNLPNGTALKATVDNAAQAESILSILPSLNRRIQPFIVVRGATSETPFYTPERPILHGEDYEMTRRMNEVTGVSTVYAVRTARNALAVYGSVRNRVEYDTVRRYALTLLPELQEAVTTAQTVTPITTPGATTAPAATTATTTSVSATAPALAAAAGLAPSPSTGALTGLTPANVPGSNHIAPNQIQMFVRVLDEAESSIRLVTVESNVVEISRNALKDLGTQFGSATLLSESVTPGTIETIPPPEGAPDGTGPTIIQNPSTITRTIDPTFNLGQGLLGDFAGFGSFSNLNPIRVRLAALMQNGTARVLSKPNLTAVEGAEAQITIGGVRPVPSTTSTGAAGGTQQTSVEFRRFGIILTMRPTVTDDDTIILQIRGDVTDLDPTTAINLGGAVIPGERVRSVDTVVTMKEGDTLVLGGLITNDQRKQTSKVPILGDIPILGALFRSKRFENNETELAIFLTPRIRRQRASMNTKTGVEMVPSLPALPDLQDVQDNVFGLGTTGQGG